MPFRALPAETFERLDRQMRTVGAACSDAQLLELADHLHDMIRARRNRRFRDALLPPELRTWETDFSHPEAEGPA